MPLSDIEIMRQREAGNIIIEPFEQRNLGSDTYDVRLGEFYYRERNPGYPQKTAYSICDPASVSDVWALHHAEGDHIWLDPGETILAHTIEFIGARRLFTTKMFARSSIGRSMLGVCKCAGRGDVGYFNRWTMEITSFSQFHRIPLRVGMRIAQIEFLSVGETHKVYGTAVNKYQVAPDLDIVKSSWRPEMMLPRLHLDWELQK